MFEEGMALAATCSKRLEDAERKVTRLVKEAEGKYSQQPFDMKDEEEA
jgi:exodeoxyribonuclease VII small subunit